MTNMPPSQGSYSPSPLGSPGQQPDSYLVWAILSTVLCCLPLGVVSIVKSTQVSGLWAQGRTAEAQKASEDARKFAVWSAGAGIAVAVVYLVIMAATLS